MVYTIVCHGNLWQNLGWWIMCCLKPRESFVSQLFKPPLSKRKAGPSCTSKRFRLDFWILVADAHCGRIGKSITSVWEIVAHLFFGRQDDTVKMDRRQKVNLSFGMLCRSWIAFVISTSISQDLGHSPATNRQWDRLWRISLRSSALNQCDLSITFSLLRGNRSRVYAASHVH